MPALSDQEQKIVSEHIVKLGSTKLSCFRGGYRNTTPSGETIDTWDALVDKVSTPQVGNKDGEYFVRGYCDGSRCEKNMASNTLIIIDGDKTLEKPDSCVPLRSIHEVLVKENITHVIYNSYSNCPNKDIYKWRVAIPCYEIGYDKVLLQQGVAEIITILHNAGLMVVNVSENNVLSQPWYFPRCTIATFDDFDCAYHDGEAYSLTGVIIPSAQFKEVNKKPENNVNDSKVDPFKGLSNASRAEVLSALYSISPDCPRNIWRNIGTALKSAFGDEYKLEWISWSKGSTNPDHEKDFENLAYQWNSFNPVAGANIETLFYHAKEAGWSFKGQRETKESVTEESFSPGSTVEDILGGFTVKREYVEALGKERWLYPDLIISGHILVIVAMPGGGKTAFLYRHVVPHMVKNGAKVFYIDADAPTSEHKLMKYFADKIGFQLINPTVNIGTGVDKFLKQIRSMVDAGTDLSNCVFIFDTLKKFTDLMSKKAVKDFFSMCRAMNSQGATNIFAAHANKFRDGEGNLIPEGVGDVKNDTDDLIIFERKKKGFGTDVTTVVDPDKGAKTRGIFEPFSFHITMEREIQLYDKPIEIDIIPGKAGKIVVTAEEILSAVEDYIREMGAPVAKTPLTEQVNDITGAGLKRVRKVISHNSELEKPGRTPGKRLVFILGERNAHYYKVPSVPFQGNLFDA